MFILKLQFIIQENMFFFTFRCEFHCCLPCLNPKNEGRNWETKNFQNKTMKELLEKDEKVNKSHKKL